MTLLALVEAFRAGELTREEMFAAATKLLSATPALLNDARVALNFDPAVRSEFEGWLAGLRDLPAIALGGRHIPVTAALISALDAAERQPLVASGPRPTLRNEVPAQFAELRPNG